MLENPRRTRRIRCGDIRLRLGYAEISKQPHDMPTHLRSQFKRGLSSVDLEIPIDPPTAMVCDERPRCDRRMNDHDQICRLAIQGCAQIRAVGASGFYLQATICQKFRPVRRQVRGKAVAPGQKPHMQSQTSSIFCLARSLQFCGLHRLVLIPCVHAGTITNPDDSPVKRK